MASGITRLRRWFAAGAILMILTVTGMYFYARMRFHQAVHDIPAKIGLDIQQTAEGFSISKSVEGHTLFKVSASKAVQFQGGGRATLHDVTIIIYGKDSSRFDQITGDEFDYDPASGNINAKGTVLIDLQSNPEGTKQSDQTAPQESKNPIHLETNGLVFNKNTGDASATGKVVFVTPQASGSAVGIQYDAKTGAMNLLAAVMLTVNRPQPIHLEADRGVLSKQPRQVVLSAVRMKREDKAMRADRTVFFLREDNTVDHILAEGNVESDFHGRTEGHARSDRAEMTLTGSRNQLTTAVLSGNVQLASQGAQPAEGSAGRVALHFGAQQLLQTVHAEDGVRLTQHNSERKAGAITRTSGGAAVRSAGNNGAQGVDGQDLAMTAPVMDFIVKNGRLLERAETSGPPQIVITQASSNQKTVVTAARFIAKFTDKNRLATLHGEPEAKIVNEQIAQTKGGASQPSERVSTSQTLDVVFQPEGGVASITQAGGLVYMDGPQKAWAERGTYTTADQMLVLSGSPRVVDGGMTTTAQAIRMNRVTGDALAEGNVKSTYSDLKPQPDGGMLSSSDPIHVTSRSMAAHRSPAIAVYTGDARLWQNANIVEAPVLQFDRDQRSLVASGPPNGGAAQPVSTVLVQMDKSGKATPVHITSARLNYKDADRQVFLDGGVSAKSTDSKMTAEQMTVFLAAREQAQGRTASTKASSGLGTSGQIERIVAEQQVVVTQPTRHAEGERLVYTSAEDKFVLTGDSHHPPSIFDAERGKITGDSLTFYRHDDRVLVEGKEKSPTVTHTQVAR